MVLKETPTTKEIELLLGKTAYSNWNKLSAFLENNYNKVTTVWSTCNPKVGVYECKFLSGSSKLCYTYLKENEFSFMVIYGKKEQGIFEEQAETFSQTVLSVYEEAKSYHDGRWLLFPNPDNQLLLEYFRLVQIKKKPNKK